MKSTKCRHLNRGPFSGFLSPATRQGGLPPSRLHGIQVESRCEVQTRTSFMQGTFRSLMHPLRFQLASPCSEHPAPFAVTQPLSLNWPGLRNQNVLAPGEGLSHIRDLTDSWMGVRVCRMGWEVIFFKLLSFSQYPLLGRDQATRVLSPPRSKRRQELLPVGAVWEAWRSSGSERRLPVRILGLEICQKRQLPRPLVQRSVWVCISPGLAPTSPRLH